MKIVIAGSTTFQKEHEKVKKVLENAGHKVLDYPHKDEDYGKGYTEYYKNLSEADVLLVMNFNKNMVIGYIGMETFAEIGFAVANNRLKDNKTEVVVMQRCSEDANNELSLFEQYHWIRYMCDGELEYIFSRKEKVNENSSLCNR